LRNDDYKIYATNVQGKFELLTDPNSPADKYLVTQAVLTIENPLFSRKNLLDHISAWIKRSNNIWGKEMGIDYAENKIVSAAAVNVATHASFIIVNKVSVVPTLVIRLIEEDKLFVSFMTDRYKNDEYGGSDKKYSRTYTPKITEVFPFVSKSSYKQTYAKAYVGTYTYFWSFIYDLRKDLNEKFAKDTDLLTQLHYEYQKDSLRAIYGEPTKVMAEHTTSPDVNKEIHFYEPAQKAIFMGTTIDFKDIVGCEIVDDPKFIPGRSTTMGLGFAFFGIGIGGAETTRTADRTIHNYVVNIKIDSMRIPLIRIATGQNEDKAEEIAQTIEYIFRHRQAAKPTSNKKTQTVTRRTKR